MGLPRKKVLVINDLSYFAIFHDFLCHTVTELQCEPLIHTDWKDGMQSLSQSKEVAMIIVDPRVEGFDAAALHRSMQEKEMNPARTVIAISRHPEDRLEFLSHSLDFAASISKTFPPQDMAFVLNRVLFPNSSERRKFPRVLAPVNVEYRMGKSSEGYSEDTFNISEGGMFLRSYRTHEPGVQLKLKLFLPDAFREIEAIGRIVYTRKHQHDEKSLMPAGMGIEFEDLDESAKQKIAEYINKSILPIDRLPQ